MAVARWFRMVGKGMAVIQQRFDTDTKSTWWSEVDPWLTDDLYAHPGLSFTLTNVLGRVRTGYIQP